MEGDGQAVKARRGPKPIDRELAAAIGSRIRARRLAMGMRQGELAGKFDAGGWVVCNIETGRSSINASNILAVCRTLGMTPNDLFGWEEAR